MGHTACSLAQKADLIVVAPATANIIGKVAGGIADDMLSTTIMAANSPVLFVPAMNDKMYENPIVQENIKNLRRWAISLWSRIRGIWPAVPAERDGSRLRRELWTL